MDVQRFQVARAAGDLGYYMGYKIAWSDYKNSKDKKQAVRDILNIQDFPAFFEKSRYAEKFSRQDK